MTTPRTNTLHLTWSTSRGRDTYGYNICRLDDHNNGRRFRCMGGGYDMTGTVVADWMEVNYQDRLMLIRERAAYVRLASGTVRDYGADALYGMSYSFLTDDVSLDGGCGLESILRVGAVIGLEFHRLYNKKGHTTGYIVTDTTL